MRRRTAQSDRTGDESLVLELMNTVWIEKGDVRDALDTSGAVQAWLAEARSRLGRAGPRAGGPARAASAALRDLRDALRRVAAELTGDVRTVPAAPGRTEAVATLNQLSAGAPRIAVLVDGTDGLTLEERFPMADDADEAVLAIVAEQGIRLLTGPEGALLRPCLAPGCLRYFLRMDARRAWCSPHCGNRARVTRHYYRHRDS